MNFKFEDDIVNNLMTVQIDLPLRKRITEERKRVKFLDVLNIVKQNYNPPSTHSLGSCISNRSIKLDNDYKSSHVGQWTFSLIPKIRSVAKKNKTSSTPRRTSSTPRRTRRASTTKKRSD